MYKVVYNRIVIFDRFCVDTLLPVCGYTRGRETIGPGILGMCIIRQKDP